MKKNFVIKIHAAWIWWTKYSNVFAINTSNAVKEIPFFHTIWKQLFQNLLLTFDVFLHLFFMWSFPYNLTNFNNNCLTRLFLKLELNAIYLNTIPVDIFNLSIINSHSNKVFWSKHLFFIYKNLFSWFYLIRFFNF